MKATRTIFYLNKILMIILMSLVSLLKRKLGSPDLLEFFLHTQVHYVSSVFFDRVQHKNFNLPFNLVHNCICTYMHIRRINHQKIYIQGFMSCTLIFFIIFCFTFLKY